MTTSAKDRTINMEQMDLDSITPNVVKRRGQPDKIIANFKRRYTYRWLPFDQLIIEEEYQRTLQKSRASVMAHNWNTDEESAPVVNRRSNGKYYIIDGMHTWKALNAIENHPPKIFCKVFNGLSLVEEARLFHSLDSKRENLTVGASFRALVVAEDDLALSIAEAADKAGYTCDYSRGPVVGNVRAFRTLQVIHTRRGPQELTKILRICNKSWPTHKDSANASMLLGLEFFLSKYEDEVTEKALIETLSKYDPAYIINQGRTINGTLSSTIYPSIAMAIRSLYNKRRRVNKLSEGF